MTITIDKEVYEKSHKLGINVSKACENYLRFLNETIENANKQIGAFSEGLSVENSSLVRLPGFEPGSSAWEASQNVDWEKFHVWLIGKKYSKCYVKDLYSYAKQYYPSLLKGDFSEIRDLSEGLRPHVIKSLSALSKFLGCYDRFKALVKDYGLTWGGRSADDIIIDRLSKIENPDEVFTWIKEVKKVRPDLSCFMDLMAVSGLRLVEAVNSYNLIIRNGNGYYNIEHSILEHFKFKETFIRKNKKAFISFIPSDLIEKIRSNQALTSADAVQQLIRKRGLKLRFSDIREAHASFMTKFLKDVEIDFLHGRVTTNVFMRNYFNPALIGDLRSRAFQGVNEILEKVKV